MIFRGEYVPKKYEQEPEPYVAPPEKPYQEPKTWKYVPDEKEERVSFF